MRLLATAGAIAACIAAALPGQAQPNSADCNRATQQIVTFVDLPGRPFAPIPTADGCWIFVSLLGDQNRSDAGIAVLARSAGKNQDRTRDPKQRFNGRNGAFS